MKLPKARMVNNPMLRGLMREAMDRAALLRPGRLTDRNLRITMPDGKAYRARNPLLTEIFGAERIVDADTGHVFKDRNGDFTPEKRKQNEREG